MLLPGTGEDVRVEVLVEQVDCALGELLILRGDRSLVLVTEAVPESLHVFERADICCSLEEPEGHLAADVLQERDLVVEGEVGFDQVLLRDLSESFLGQGSVPAHRRRLADVAHQHAEALLGRWVSE